MKVVRSRKKKKARLCYIDVSIDLFRAAFEVLSLDKNADAFLDERHTGLEQERQLIENLGHQLLVFQLSVHFHDAHYGGLYTMDPIFFAVTMDIFVFINIDGPVDVEPQFATAELGVERKQRIGLQVSAVLLRRQQIRL